jgi:hypothetical protein
MGFTVVVSDRFSIDLVVENQRTRVQRKRDLIDPQICLRTSAQESPSSLG